MTIYFADKSGYVDEPIEMECKLAFGEHYPLGNTMYDNTHFRTRAAAFDSLLAEATAGVTLDAREIARLEKQLARAKDDLAKMATWRLRIEEKMRND